MSCKVNFHEHCSILVRLSSTHDAVLDYDKFEQQQKTFFIFDLDCEQSLFFFRFSESNARARERRSRETRETRAAAREEKRETARLARANELSVGLTTQNTIG